MKKTDYNTKISNIEKKINDHNHDKYIITPELNTLAARVFNARLAQANVITKTDFDTELKKITSNESKHAAYFRCKNYFDGDGTQNYLVFQPVHKYFERVGNDISSWESKRYSNEKIRFTTITSNNKFATNLIYLNARLEVEFNGNFLKQDKVT